MKIFIGTEEIASLLTDLTFGFRELGFEVTTYARSQNKFYPLNRYDILRGKMLNDIFHYEKWKILPPKLKYYMGRIDDIVTIPYLKLRNRKIIKEHDVFIFIWQPWLKESYLFPLLKKKGKKIICFHVGTDVRHISAFEQQYNIDTSDWEEFFHKDLLEPKIKKIRCHELYADLIYSVPDQAGLYLRGYNHFRIPLRNSKNIIFNIPARKNPLIIHAPSRSGIKGTAIINATMEKLKQDGYEFEYRLIQNMPNEKLLELLTDADILCDELYLHGPAMLSAEAMAAGCAVATRCLDVFPFQPPVCAITPENLYEKLKLLITDIEYRISLAKEGKAFVENFNSPPMIAEKILNDLDASGSEYQAGFFIEKFQLPSGLNLSEETKALTNQVIVKYNLQDESIRYKLKERGLV